MTTEKSKDKSFLSEKGQILFSRFCDEINVAISQATDPIDRTIAQMGLGHYELATYAAVHTSTYGEQWQSIVAVYARQDLEDRITRVGGSSETAEFYRNIFNVALRDSLELNETDKEAIRLKLKAREGLISLPDNSII